MLVAISLALCDFKSLAISNRCDCGLAIWASVNWSGKPKRGLSNGGLRPLSAICAQSSTIVHFCDPFRPLSKVNFRRKMTTIAGNRGQLWTSTLSPHLLSPHLDFPDLGVLLTLQNNRWNESDPKVFWVTLETILGHFGAGLPESPLSSDTFLGGHFNSFCASVES